MKRTVVAALVAALMTVAAAPAHAAPLEWKDAENDATGLFVTSTPLPSEPALDVTTVRMERKGDQFAWSAKIKKLAAAPTAATGYEFRFYFTYQDEEFQFMVEEETVLTAAGAGGVFFYTSDQLQELPCARCAGRIDRKTSTVSVQGSLAAISAGLRAFDRTYPPLAAGARFDTPYVITQRLVALATLTADEARSPQGAAFTF